MRVLQWTFTYFATVFMIIGSVPGIALAKSAAKPVAKAAAKSKDVSKASEDTLEAFKMMRPKYTNPRLAHVYSQWALHMSGEQKNEFQKILVNKGHLPAPDVKLDGEEIVLSQDGHSLRLKFIGDAKNHLKIYANGKLLEAEDLKTPAATIKALEKIVTVSGKKSAFLWPLQLLLPEAHAIDWTTLLIGAAIGVVGYMAYKYFFASDEKKCAIQGAVCCYTTSPTGLYFTPPASGCCTDVYPDAAAYTTMPSNGCSGQVQPQSLPVAPTTELPADTTSQPGIQ